MYKKISDVITEKLKKKISRNSIYEEMFLALIRKNNSAFYLDNKIKFSVFSANTPKQAFFFFQIKIC